VIDIFTQKAVGVKDKILSIVARKFANSYIEKYGKILKLEFDSQLKTIDLEVMLDGEKEPLILAINHYEIIQEGSAFFFIINDIKSSRRWINTLAKQYIYKKRFSMPAEYAKILKIVV